MIRPLCRSRCGGYIVEIIRDRIVVECGICGPAGRFSPSGARKLATELRGILGRFQTTALRQERFRLAALLLEEATELEARRKARRRRQGARS